jgi:hypothetical protein
MNAELELAKDCGRFFDDALGFVLYAFPWDSDPALQVVKLPAPWNMVYNCEYGPDVWACEFLDEVSRQVRERNFDGRSSVMPQRHATTSGHGIGKSALTAWLVQWIMSTRPFAKGTVTANKAEQLSAKTWAEIAKWNKKSITGHWFDVTTGKGAMKMVHKQHRESWFCNAQTCREENSEAFAGQHAANSTSFYIFDEASAVPDKIYEVAEGGLTDGEPMFFVFGNPTRNTGKFFECFNAQKHRWTTRRIDSRQVQVSSKDLINEWVADYGEDSDFVRVRVRGVFPRASSLQFIPRDVVDDAMARVPAVTALGKRTAVVGVDVARFGDDQSVICTRIGRDAATHPLKAYRGISTMQLAARVIEHVELLKTAGYRVVIMVDGGGVGGGVVDRLQQLNYDPVEVQFGGKADDNRKWANKRAEMWGRMREWLATGCLAKNEELATDMTSVEYMFKPDDTIILEAKEAMKRRGLASPDAADALAITFAQVVPEFAVAEEDKPVYNYGRKAREHDPYANLN